MLVTEREGALRLVRNGTVSGPIAGVPEVAAWGQGGFWMWPLIPTLPTTILFT